MPPEHRFRFEQAARLPVVWRVLPSFVLHKGVHRTWNSCYSSCIVLGGQPKGRELATAYLSTQSLDRRTRFMYILVATLTKQETVMKKKVLTAIAYIAAGILICIIGRKVRERNEYKVELCSDED